MEQTRETSEGLAKVMLLIKRIPKPREEKPGILENE